MSAFDLEGTKKAFQEQLDGRARSSAAERASVLAPLREQLQGLVDPALFAAVEQAAAGLREAQRDLAEADSRVRALQVARVAREQVPQLVRDRALAAGELLEYRRLAEDARVALTRAEGAVTAAARQAWAQQQTTLIAAFEAARRTGAAEVARLEEEFKRAEAEALRPAHAAAGQIQLWRLLADELGIDTGSYVTRMERVTPATKLPGSEAA